MGHATAAAAWLPEMCNAPKAQCSSRIADDGCQDLYSVYDDTVAAIGIECIRQHGAAACLLPVLWWLLLPILLLCLWRPLVPSHAF